MSSEDFPAESARVRSGQKRKCLLTSNLSMSEIKAGHIKTSWIVSLSVYTSVQSSSTYLLIFENFKLFIIDLLSEQLYDVTEFNFTTYCEVCLGT